MVPTRTPDWRKRMSEQEFFPPLIRFEKINPDSDFYLGEGKAFRQKDRACDKAFERFERLRGQILSQAIAVEKELARLIAWYFVPRLWPKHDDSQREEDDRRDKLIDFVLGQESFMLSSKIDAVISISEGMEVTTTSATRIRNAFRPVVEIRNQFAHRRVGINWRTQQMAFWDAKKRKWGFPFFDEKGKRDDNKRWREWIPDDLGDNYSEYCRKALALLENLSGELRKLRRMDSSGRSSEPS